MMEGTRGAVPHRMRGFLFADLRDYTRYVEARGDHAGAALLGRYRALVRDAIARAEGAEIKTEGDSFYVVFDSASAAVRAGLAIIAAATAAGPVDPIRVGVGVHAGETVETADGFVGSAVNIAARLCAEAKQGELVVSDTVRSLTRTYLDVAFEPLGARRLKGVEEAITVYRVVPRRAATELGPSAQPVAGRRPSRLLIAGLGAAALVVVAVAVGWSGIVGQLAPTPGPAAAAVASPPVAASAPSSPPASATLGPFPNEVEIAILAALPAGLAETCVRGGTIDDARLAGFIGTTGDGITVTPSGSRGGVTCHPVTGASRLYVMTPWSEMAVSGTPADELLGWMAGAHKIPDGSCATEDRAHQRWFGPRGTGIVACMNPYDRRSWVYFTFGKGRYLAFATRDDGDYAALYAWWDELKTFLP